MAAVEKLPSGKWRARVRAPDGRARPSFTDPLKSVVMAWAADLEAEYRRGSRRDPNAGRMPLGDWYARWRGSRHWSKRHAERMDGIWRTYLQPRWGHVSVDTVSPLEIRGWLADLTREQVGAATVRKCHNLLAPMLADAVADGLIATNPALLPRGTLPRMAEKPPDFYTHAEVDAITGAAGEHGFVLDLAAHCGFRWAELAALAPSSFDERTEQIHVTRVVERDGTIRDYPKSRQRAVPVPAHLADRLPSKGTLMFPAPRGGPWRYHNFRHRVWKPAVGDTELRDLGIHGLRHTCASWLVMAGVPLYTVRDVLGHSSLAVTQRYAHLAPGAHDAVRLAWARTAGPPVGHSDHQNSKVSLKPQVSPRSSGDRAPLS